MHIIVCLKQVPDTNDVRIDPETNTLIREGVASIMNPFDENALEAALAIKDAQGATVTAISMGPPQAGDMLREAIARGADNVYLVSDRAFAGSDTLATSYALAKAIRTLPAADLVLFGKQAIDGDTAQVGPGVAELLGLPIITYVRKVTVQDQQLEVERAFEDGFERMSVPLPAVLTVLKETNVPRMASLRGRMKAKKVEVPVLKAADIEAESHHVGLTGSPTQVIRIFTPPKKQGGVTLDGSHGQEAAQQAVALLRERKVI
ncbi:MAG: electron transfer flavoprotein subunit beta/FixA family protein [Candidatus Marinimicrobia bacterium]|nr:electron transfer flavoprotein subunit beta/FixA family protein [Candidatus Neomarinimicrobiota bacterium]